MTKRAILFTFLIAACYVCSAQVRDLPYFLQQAQNASPLIKDYQNQVQSLGVDSELIRASYRPQVNGISNNVYAPIFHGFGYDNAISNGGQISAQVQVTKTFAGNNNLNTQYRTIALDKTTIGINGSVAKRDLDKTVTAQYIVTYGDNVTVGFNREMLDLLQKEDTLLRALTQNNVYKQADYLTFYVTLQQQELLYRQSEIQWRNDYAQLNYLCGINDTGAAVLPDPGIRIGEIPDAGGSLFYRQFLTDSLKNINQREVIRYSYKPKLSMFGDAGYLSSLAYEAQKNFGASVGLTLNVPIYDGKQKKMKLSKIEIAERTRANYRDFFVRQYSQQIAQLKQQLRATEGLIEQIGGQIKYARTLIDVNAKLLESGDVRITDLVLAVNTYLNARNLLNQNHISRLQILNQIRYWQTP
ncbi:MAG TPA: TolC family protein [Puia sp.]|jgi:hypothetical protein